MPRIGGQLATSALSNKHSSDAMNGRGRGAREHIALAIVVGLVSFLMVTAWSQVRGQSATSEARREQLAALVAARQRTAGVLERELAGLRRQLDEQARTSAGSSLRALERERERMALAA